MKKNIPQILVLLLLFLPGLVLHATVFTVSTQNEFEAAHNQSMPNDSILWTSGTHTDIYMQITKNDLYIGAVVLGEAIFNGASRVRITSDYITLEGLQFLGGDIGTNDVINTAGSYNHFNEINISSYTSYKYLVVRESCQYVDITYCNFENRLNLDDKNILSILVSEDHPGYHRIQHCSFKNFDGTGNDMGIEPIRIGLSTQGDRNSRTLVEYCYFTQCNGDGEIISNKARQNVFRFNTFQDNPKAELVLRHGSSAIVYGNFFLNGKGGIRVREGQQHYLYNNYFEGLSDRAIYLQNDSSDPLEDIHIAFNTIVGCSEVILGSDGSYPPSNVSLVNNIFSNPIDDLFEDATGTETWIGNIANGSLGIASPGNGINETDPLMVENSVGYWSLTANSPAVDAALPGYEALPIFMGIPDIDAAMLFDLMQQSRPAVVEEKDLGCNEYPHNLLIQPISTEENTGPSYDSDFINPLVENPGTSPTLVEVFPNPFSHKVQIVLNKEQQGKTIIEILDIQGQSMTTVSGLTETINTGALEESIEALPTGTYFFYIKRIEKDGLENTQVIKLIKL